VAVIRDLNSLQASKRIVLQRYVDAIGIRVNGVPYQLGNRQDRLSNLSKPLEMIFLDVNFVLRSFGATIAGGE
jgi:hypothetical protein